MKIQSRYKDYYDYVAHQFGGGDPKVVYERERVVAPTYHDGQIAYENTMDVPTNMSLYIPNSSLRWGRNITGSSWYFKGLVVAGRWYMLRQESRAPAVRGTSKEFPKRELGPWTIHITREASGQFQPRMVELSRLVKAPVFTVVGDGYNYHKVEGKVPHLGDLGFAKIMSPEQCYQEIAMFLGNTILVNPDETPESKPPLTNEERAVAHGFDKKVSFRHRK
jgi:hypothetical protein